MDLQGAGLENLGFAGHLFSVLIYAYNMCLDQFYASYLAGTKLLTDTSKLYKPAVGNCFELEEWGPIEFAIMAKHFDRHGEPPYGYHAMSIMAIDEVVNSSFPPCMCHLFGKGNVGF
ncbi:hypothetical protein MKW94_003977 [Papaver nudicaule]|uniref:Uncharacterized protein n=1 Tax=Papaver nudicaule TaxID=74823 RepID=A0AA42B4M5_PAPNU|nr:hypothetical protein [Papaver nudicaule]MCL7050251.1 hypothetical protein [Papaver nudicaule]